MSEYRPKSERMRLESSEGHKPVQSVVSSPGRVGNQKSGFLDKIILGDPKEVARTVMSNVVLPALKDTFLDSVMQGLSMLLNNTPNKRGVYQNRPNYRAYYGDAREPVRANPRKREGLELLTYEARPDAERVLSEMKHHIVDYGVVTAANYYEYSGVRATSSDYSLWDYGWDDLSDVGVRRLGDGYFIELPEPEPLKDMERRKS